MIRKRSPLDSNDGLPWRRFGARSEDRARGAQPPQADGLSATKVAWQPRLPPLIGLGDSEKPLVRGANV
jgi:hypothetical protein